MLRTAVGKSPAPMSRRAFVAAVLILATALLGLGGTGLRAAQAPTGIQQMIERAQAHGRIRVIVGLRADHQPERELPDAAAVAAQRARLAQATETVVSSIRTGSVGNVRQVETLPYFAADVDAASLGELFASALIASIQEDVPRPMALSQSVPMIEAPLAWDAGYSGAGWAIAVLDSGIDTAHPFLVGKVISESCFSTTDGSGATSSSSLCPGGLSSASGSGTATPCQPLVANCDHGTHVAGIAAGAGSTFSGVARDAGIVSIQVFSKFSATDCGGSECLLAWDSDVIAALDRVYASREALRIAAVNLSLGGALYPSACDAISPAMTAAIGQLRDAGIPTVVAAGNAGSTAGLAFPACISTSVSVGSVNKSDVVSSFSNSSALLSLLAPGEPISSSVPGGGFAFKMGTSMAAPHVAGAWAVLKQRKPNGTVDEVLGAIRRTARPVIDSRTGTQLPRIQVKAALDTLGFSEPLMVIDTPGSGAVPLPFTVAGWAGDRGASAGTGVDAVHIWAFPTDGRSPMFAAAATLGVRRDDVAALVGSNFATSGYRASVDGLPPGSYTLVVYAHSTVSGTFNQSRSVDVTVRSSWPVMSLDGPLSDSTMGLSFTVNGWAGDRMASTGTGVDSVHVWAFPVNGGEALFAGVASYGELRTDVGNLLGRQFDRSGYSLNVTTLPAGSYSLVVFAHSTVSGTFNQSCVARITLRSQP